MSDEDPESGGGSQPADKSNNDASKQKSAGMGQGAKDDIGVCVVIILITVLAIIVTVIKIILFDVTQYPELFGTQATTTVEKAAAEAEAEMTSVAASALASSTTTTEAAASGFN